MESPRDHSKCLARLLLFPLPLQGHINPMFQLAHILHSRGFRITIIHTEFNSPNPSNYPQYSFVSIPDKLVPDEASNEHPVSLLTTLNARLVEPFANCLAELLSSSSEEEEESIACLISDPIWHFTQAVADGLKLPRLVLQTSNASSFLAYANFPLFRDKGYLHVDQDHQPEEELPMLPKLKPRDLPMVEPPHHETFYQVIVKSVDQIRASSGMIINTFEELETDSLATLTQDFPHTPIFAIGPFHRNSYNNSLLAADQSCISWLDHQAPRSVLYVSFGSLATIGRSEFQEVAWGIAGSNQPFLWVVRPGLVSGSDSLPDGFAEIVGGRGLVVKWAPQPDVLAHPATGGFWTHNGWNSVLESVCEGVPMICYPNAGDQMVNARFVSDVWGIGLHLEGKVERKEIEDVVRRLMVGAEGEELRRKVMCLKEKAEVCLKQGGSSGLSLEKLTSYILSFQLPVEASVL